ncbi:MAG: bifunctional UDP-sugar hydrolase/5'-nucleotidase [Candidatus Rifleibacteriota bacterium]
MKRFVSILLLLVFSVTAQATETTVKILHTNDTHARIIPIDSKLYGKNVSGAIRRASFISKIKQQAPDTLVLDSGDMFQGTPFFTFFKGEACYKIAKAMGYDATTLGNHELDNSLSLLLEKLRISDMLLLCCNVFYRNTDKPVFKPYEIFERFGKKIAVIGSIGDEAWDVIDRKTKAPLYAKPQFETVKEFVSKVRNDVDLVIVLSHSGFEKDKLMAARVPGIDVILGGHSHTEVNNPVLVTNAANKNGIAGTIVTQAGEHGIFVGMLDLTMSEDGQIATYSGGLHIIDSTITEEPNPEVAKLVKFYHEQLKSKMAQIAGKSEFELSYPKDQKKVKLLPMGSFTAMAMKDCVNADVCLVNSGGIRAGIKAGNITWGQIFEALPYDNTVVTFLMKGKDVKKMFDFVAKNPDKLDGFQFAGISGTIDQVKGECTGLKINNEIIDDEKIYRICTSSFIANGNLGGDLLFANCESIEDSSIFMREAAIKYLEKVKELQDFSKNPLTLIAQ